MIDTNKFYLWQNELQPDFAAGHSLKSNFLVTCLKQCRYFETLAKDNFDFTELYFDPCRDVNEKVSAANVPVLELKFQEEQKIARKLSKMAKFLEKFNNVDFYDLRREKSIVCKENFETWRKHRKERV